MKVQDWAVIVLGILSIVVAAVAARFAALQAKRAKVQADAAKKQADAAKVQADAANKQADAATKQADAAIEQIHEARRQVKEARQSRQLTGILPLYSAYQSAEISQTRHFIRRLTRGVDSLHQLDHDTREDINSKIEQLPPEERLQLRDYINHLDFIAILVENRLLDENIVRTVFKDGATRCWYTCEGYIKDGIRSRERRMYASALERLVHRWEVDDG